MLCHQKAAVLTLRDRGRSGPTATLRQHLHRCISSPRTRPPSRDQGVSEGWRARSKSDGRGALSHLAMSLIAPLHLDHFVNVGDLHLTQRPLASGITFDQSVRLCLLVVTPLWRPQQRYCCKSTRHLYVKMTCGMGLHARNVPLVMGSTVAAMLFSTPAKAQDSCARGPKA